MGEHTEGWIGLSKSSPVLSLIGSDSKSFHFCDKERSLRGCWIRAVVIRMSSSPLFSRSGLVHGTVNNVITMVITMETTKGKINNSNQHQTQ